MPDKNKSKAAPKSDNKKSSSSPKVKDLAPKKDPRGGATDHPPKRTSY